jgi:hypothetical protein
MPSIVMGLTSGECRVERQSFMNFSRCIVVCGLGLFLAAACGDDDGGGASVRSVCEKGCAIEASLACPMDTPATCVSQCEQSASAIPAECRPQVDAARACAANLPASEWECADGTAGPKPDACAAEGTAAINCLNGDDGCFFADDGECDDPTGTDNCPAGTDVADCS